MEVNCQCTPLGTSDETEFTPARNLSFYLNTAHPALCSGTIERWRYCFYRPDTSSDNDRHRVTWAVYRRMGSGNDTHYSRVESSVRTATVRNHQMSNFGNFLCQYQNVADFDVEVGDIVEACIYESSRYYKRKQLHIVGQANGYSLTQTSDESHCGDNSMPSRISTSQLSTIDSKILHLFGIIACTLTLYTMLRIENQCMGSM